eukprot:131473-Pelagomonas_calceolata.AAC.4
MLLREQHEWQRYEASQQHLSAAQLILLWSALRHQGLPVSPSEFRLFWYHVFEQAKEAPEAPFK